GVIAGPTLTSARRPAFTYSVQDVDDTFTMTCMLGHGDVTEPVNCSSTSYTPASDLADGGYSLAVIHKDRAGNIGDAVTKSFTVDGTAPSLSQPVWDAAAKNATFTAEQGATTLCAVDGGQQQQCSSPYAPNAAAGWTPAGTTPGGAATPRTDALATAQSKLAKKPACKTTKKKAKKGSKKAKAKAARTTCAVKKAKKKAKKKARK